MRETNTPISIIQWRPRKERPDNGSYILLKCLDESGSLSCEFCSYENGCFIYRYDNETWGEVNEAVILGWSYLPFDEH